MTPVTTETMLKTKYRVLRAKGSFGVGCIVDGLTAHYYDLFVELV